MKAISRLGKGLVAVSLGLAVVVLTGQAASAGDSSLSCYNDYFCEDSEGNQWTFNPDPNWPEYGYYYTDGNWGYYTPEGSYSYSEETYYYDKADNPTAAWDAYIDSTYGWNTEVIDSSSGSYDSGSYSSYDSGSSSYDSGSYSSSYDSGSSYSSSYDYSSSSSDS